MRRIEMLATLVLTMVVTGCEPSLQPLFTKQEAFFQPALVGTWVDKDGDSVEFDRSGEKCYRVTYKDVQATGSVSFDGCLGRLGKFLFLDVARQEQEVGNDFHAFGLWRIHWFFKVSMERNVLRTSILDGDWIAKMAREKRLLISHASADGSTVLTASTKELQRFVLRYGEDKDAFSASTEWHRRN